jgi:hypothetical protein
LEGITRQSPTNGCRMLVGRIDQSMEMVDDTNANLRGTMLGKVSGSSMCHNFPIRRMISRSGPSQI